MVPILCQPQYIYHEHDILYATIVLRINNDGEINATEKIGLVTPSLGSCMAVLMCNWNTINSTYHGHI